MRLSFFRRTIPVAAFLLLIGGVTRAQSASELTAEGDAFDLKFNGTEALKFYLPAEKLEPANAPLLTRISRQYRYLMSDAGKKTEKLRLGGIAIDYAKRAAAAGPNDSDAQLALAIGYGRLQPLASVKEKIATARIIKMQAEKAIKLDRGNDLAWHVLGRWHMGYAELTGVKRKMAEMTYGSLPVSTFEEAAKCFEQAAALKPERVLNQIELGEVYARLGRNAEARTVLSKGLALRQTDKDDAEVKARGRETLSKLP
ncbi:MAG: tetratricopeptide repeat protein [Chthoniobacterales bacterium]